MRVKYSHKVWDRFVHAFEKSVCLLNMYILIHGLYATIMY